jgi:hypothetical protein
VLLALALISCVLGAVIADLVDTVTGRRMPVPWTTVLTLAVIVAGLLTWTLYFRAKLKNEGSRINPFMAMRTAALAMAASRFGALAAGFFGGVGLWFAVDLTTALARERLFACLASVFLGLVMVVVALWLERICRLPDEPEDDAPTSSADELGGDWVHPSVH